MSSDFVHLHVHSEYSLLDGLGRTAHLAKEAARLGQPALALTDHGVMHGAIEFFRNCKKTGVKPIIGVEAYMTPLGRKMQDKDPHKDKMRHHLLLLAQNMTGYKNLLKICSDAQLQGYYYKPRIDADYLAAHAEGLICTTGCMAAEIPWLLNPEDGRVPQPDKALERLRWYLDIFGPDRFYVELQEHSISALTEINKTLFQWAGQHNLNLLATNDVHYVTAQDAKPHDTLLCVQTSSLINQPKRMRMSDNSYYLKSLEEMQAIFRPLVDLPHSAFTNSLKIAEMCEVDLEDSSFHLPDLPPGVMPEGFNYETFLLHLTAEGLKKRYGDRANSPEVQARKEHELNIINNMGFAIYYLIVWDLCEYARRRGIWWNVRGSGAGSIVAYATGITLIDPLRHNLIFERFLNPGRISMPDFDLDYPDDQREELIRYTIQRYGSDRVAQIVSFGRMKARAAIRDVGRAMDVPLTEVDVLAKQVSAIPGKPATIDNVLDSGHEFFSSEFKVQYDNVDYVQELVDCARNLEGVARHSSVHAAAVIVTDKPLTEYVPVMRPQGSVITDSITQFEFPICESIGLLKVDFLGLSTLTVMRKAAELIKRRYGKNYNLNNIPTRDKKAFALLASGNVTGVFQVEGAGMRRILTSMKPSKFEHIIAILALYRPGPLQYIPNFIARMHGEEEVTYRHPALESILAETYGIIVYQEQIMRIATDLAGYTASEADFMRKAVAKKKEKDLLKHKEKMIQGGLDQDIPKQAMLDIFSDIEAFARYGFPKGHAADYAVITCQTAYLKAHYPIEYMTALLTVERGNTEKVGKLIGECRARGIEILPPSINHSSIEFTIEDQPNQNSFIRFSLAAIKNVGESPIQDILDALKESGSFKDVDDFCTRVDLRRVGRRALEGIIKVGGMDEFAERHHLLAIIDRMINLSSSTHKASSAGQISMFDVDGFDAPQLGSVIYPEPKDMISISQRELLSLEKELTGAYLSSHPIQKYLPQIKAAKITMLGELDDTIHEQQITVAGMINSVRHLQTKKGDPMAFVEIEDIQSTCEIVVFPRVFATHKNLLANGNLIVVKGKIDASEGRSPKVLANSISDEITIYGEKMKETLGDYTSTSYETSTPLFQSEKMTLPTTSSERQQKQEKRHNGNYIVNDRTVFSNIAQKPQQNIQNQLTQSETVSTGMWIHIIMYRTGDFVQDKHRLKIIYDLLVQTPGQDRFSIYIPNGNKKIRLDFPNNSTCDTVQLRQQLTQILGAKAIRVEAIQNLS